jgi:hypothetical protein
VTCNLRTHLRWRRTTQDVSRVERAAQAQTLKHIGFDLGVEDLQLGQ